ncbi:uncharacterized protein DDB_G0287625-like [Clytia hemisphaerica]|uniref:Uncharacterized protein n=1 Tax=Clytia hemisphaerica TaxID=252671 RepID=A0A7M5VGB7_9CNID
MTEERIPKEWAIVVVHGFGREGQNREEETIVPIHWMDQKTKQLFWPPSKSQEGNFNAQPTDTWKKYVLKKIKFQGDKLTCEKVYNENLLVTSQSECDANTSKVSNMDTMDGAEMPNPITENILINQSSTPGSKLQQRSCSRSRNSHLKSSCLSLKSSHSNSRSRSMSRRRSRSISRRRSRSKSRRSRSKSRRSRSKSRRSRSKSRRSRSK